MANDKISSEKRGRGGNGGKRRGDTTPNSHNHKDYNIFGRRKETGEDVAGHMLVERLLFVDRDMIRHGKDKQKKIRKTLTLRTTAKKQRLPNTLPT